MARPSLLIVEDDDTLAQGLAFTLEREGYSVAHAGGKAEAEALLSSRSFDLLVLDVMLPDGSGYDLCRSVRLRSAVPVIFLTARDEEVNVVRGLELGADDYVAKPFRIKELASRIKAALRRSAGGRDADAPIVSGPFTIDLAASRAYRAGRELGLTAVEFRLLALLVRNAGQTLSRSLIIGRLLDVEEPFVDDNTLSVYIRRLREKLEEDPSRPGCIVTVRGVGYRWEEGNETGAAP